MKRKFIWQVTAVCLLILIGNTSFAQENLTYQVPPASIVDLVDAPTTPNVMLSKNADFALLCERPDYPTIADVSQPVLGLAGLRLNPANNASAVGTGFTGLTFKNLKTGVETRITGLPENARLSNLTLSPDEKYLAFVLTGELAVTLWVADLAKFEARQLSDRAVNGAYGTTLAWAPNGAAILTQFIPADRGSVPAADPVPTGPVVQQNLGKAAPSRTYQNLLKNAHDESLFDHYLTAQLSLMDLSGNIRPIGAPGIYRSFSYSPDGNYLLVQRVERPYSYLVPASSFPYQVALWDAEGREVKKLHQAPLAESTPIGFDAVAPGPRSYGWRPDMPAAIYWVEALDGGDPRKRIALRDAVFQWLAPFSEEPSLLIKTGFRYSGIDWADQDYAILNERWWQSRTQKRILFNSNTGDTVKTIVLRSYEDNYTDPGDFVTTRNTYNRSVLLLDKGKQPTVFTTATGASPEGDRPFLLKWNLISGRTDTLFKSQAPYYESPVYFNNTGTLIISRESVEESPNYFQVNLRNRRMQALTNFSNPYPTLAGVQKQQLAYPRNDGLTLTGTLYLPKDYRQEDGPLPMLMWAYPREFKSAAAASQVKGSPYRYTRIAWGSPIYWVTRGYAVLDNADMPIVGEGDQQPNDTFVKQLQANASAAVDYVVSLGVADRHRIGVGGHSYGAFMTANLLAHTDLFAAGLARSGAYNRTFTPFGFQQEERTYWQAPEVYYNMSPFSFAHQMTTPLLLIHGMDDENSGTFPIQSERLYNAIKGHGGTTRLVFLPKEFHGYRARESILHTLWEMDQWLETYVKHKK